MITAQEFAEKYVFEKGWEVFDPENKVTITNVYAGDWAEEIADLLEWALDEHASNDGFGTEGQCDPRGDQRDNKVVYTMYFVQGVDK